MNTVHDIEQAVRQLRPDELATFRTWFAEYDSATDSADFRRATADLDGLRYQDWVPACYAVGGLTGLSSLAAGVSPLLGFAAGFLAVAGAVIACVPAGDRRRVGHA